MSKLLVAVTRARYVVLAAWLAPWLWLQQRHSYPRGDWIWLELGARVLFHHHAPSTGGPSLGVYADNPAVQMGPPALLLDGPLQWLPPHVGEHLAAALMALAVLPCLYFLERAAATSLGAPAAARRIFSAGALAVPAWAIAADSWGHLDDVVALVLVSAATFLVASGRRDVIAGLLLGTAAATKPWAAVLMPLVLAYDRRLWSRAILAFVLGGLIWWMPFVIAAPATVHALGSLSLLMVNHPTWALVGMHGSAPSWIRALQLVGGVVLCAYTVRRSGWVAAPLLLLAWRVTTDPYDWSYYILGPLVGAALYDLARPVSRRVLLLPWASISVVVVEWAVRHFLPPLTPAVRLVWFLALAAVVLGPSRAQTAPVGADVAAAFPSSHELAPA